MLSAIDVGSGANEYHDAVLAVENERAEVRAQAKETEKPEPEVGHEYGD